MQALRRTFSKACKAFCSAHAEQGSTYTIICSRDLHVSRALVPLLFQCRNVTLFSLSEPLFLYSLDLFSLTSLFDSFFHDFFHSPLLGFFLFSPLVSRSISSRFSFSLSHSRSYSLSLSLPLILSASLFCCRGSNPANAVTPSLRGGFKFFRLIRLRGKRLTSGVRDKILTYFLSGYLKN